MMQADPDTIVTAERVRWGILGAANIAVKYVAPAIVTSSNGELVAVASRNPARGRDAYAFVPGVRVYSDYESLINDSEIDAIYNPLPNSLHAEWSIRALQAGKHVLCEKPLAVTVEEGEQMVEAARASGKLLMEAFMYRFHPQTVWTLKQIAEGRIGRVRLIYSSFSFNIMNPPRPKDIRLQAALAGGSLMDVGCYPINFCRAVYGHSPVAASARVYTPAGYEVELSANAVLDYGDGRFALIDSSCQPARSRRSSAKQAKSPSPSPSRPACTRRRSFSPWKARPSTSTLPPLTSTVWKLNTSLPASSSATRPSSASPSPLKTLPPSRLFIAQQATNGPARTGISK